MFQKFYTDTLGGRYIKSLLSQTPIPMFNAVMDGDQLIEGCYYVYKRFLIRCNTSGVLQVDSTDVLYPSDILYPSVWLFPKYGIKVATFYVISIVDIPDKKTHETFHSDTNYYDSETHFYLGKYLRYLYSTTGLNLFPYYNCFTSQYFSDVELTIKNAAVVGNRKLDIQRAVKQSFKVAAVPILFGHDYTIAIDCPTEVYMRACIHSSAGYVEESSLPTKLTETLSNSGKIFSKLSFGKPVTFRVENGNKEAALREHELYLLIQLPLTNNSSIVVLENYEHKPGIYCNEDGVRDIGILNPSLLRMNTHVSYAFSDRLIEYLLGNVITSQETITENISKVQNALGRLNTDYRNSFSKGVNRYGIFDKDIPRHVLNLVESYGKDNVIYDHDGNINCDVERILQSKGGNY